MEIDFNFINSQSVILIVKGIAAGIGDDTKQVLQKEGINAKYSTSEKYIKWDLLYRNIRNNLRNSHIIMDFSKIPGWTLLPLFDSIEGNLYLIMKENRFDSILKTHNKRKSLHYIEDAIRTFNKGIESYTQTSLFEDKEETDTLSKVLEGILVDLSLDRQLVRKFVVILFDELNGELTAVRCCLVDSNYNIVKQEDWSQYIEHNNSVITEKITSDEELPSMLNELDLTDKAKRKIGQNHDLAEEIDVQKDDEQTGNI